ncbi:MAG: mobile mystery protein A [Alphaproteobacteria bacterium]
MNNQRLAAQSRQSLDARFAKLRPTERFKPPVRGWIKAIREALGMSSAQLAKRLKIKQPSVVQIEQSELRGTVQLATLRRVAEALNCTLVYALVPNEPLAKIVRQQARKVARRRLQLVEHSLLLESQGVPAKDFEAHIDAFVRDMNPRILWDEA